MTFTQEQMLEFSENWSDVFGTNINEKHPLYNACKLYFEMMKEISSDIESEEEE